MVLSLFLLAGGRVVSAQGWEAGLRVRVGSAETVISLGQLGDATDGYDGFYDVPAMLSGDLEVFFKDIPRDISKRGKRSRKLRSSGVTAQGRQLWRDIRGLNSGRIQLWELQVDSPLVGEIVKISWNSGEFPAGGDVLLYDLNNRSLVKMRAVADYSFANTGSRVLRILWRPSPDKKI